MRNDLQDNLYIKYTELFKNVNYHNEEYMVVVDCDNGWYSIIDELCSKIVSYCRDANLPIHFVQIKEKFGDLRIYYDMCDEYIDSLIHDAVVKSRVSCEKCGKPGVLRKGGWVQTLCDEHADGREAYKTNSDD